MTQAMKNKVTGTYRQTMRGFGFVIPDEPRADGDLFIPAGENLDAVTGDIVVARVIARRDKRTFGRVVQIVKRRTNRVVGTLIKHGERWLVVPDGNIFKTPIEVQDIGAQNAAENDKVVLDLLRYPQGDQLAQGVITEILGTKGEPEVELQSVIRQFELPQKFSDVVMDQARVAAINYDPNDFFASGRGGNREDLRDELIITIDPDDARDFDDAISLRELTRRRTDAEKDGGGAVWELGVHIADVSSFVGVESPMDLEARIRGNSTYFPGHVIPMLPAILSNGVCSLQENQPRLCKSAFIRYNAVGHV
ncbi:MAG: RNB domain-containing ribonuclease, partial [Phycisphaerales bacterium]|nr:RNB domain-containing ribonuclease [Phycisphaerales bacterium]